jgi:hypothetical protein
MGKRYTVFDDLDEKLDAERTVPFSLDNVAYEIDLSAKNIKAIEDALAPFMAAGRKVGRTTSGRSGGGSRKAANPELDAIRHWASQNNLRVSDKGRIPRDVVDAYNAAQTSKPAPAKAAKAPAKASAEPAFSAADK